MFALFEDDFTIIHGAAGFAAFGSSTSGYGYHKKNNHFKSIIRSLKMVAFFTFLYKQVLRKKLMTAYLRVVFLFVADVFFVVVFFVEEVLLVDETFVAGL